VVAQGVLNYRLARRRVPVRYPLEITVDGETMTIRGLDPVLIQAAGGAPMEFQIEPAPAGTC
jgi:hypothetical protein